MKPEKILYAMNDIDGQFLREAREETAPAVKPYRRRFAVLIAAVVALMAISITAFAAEEIAGWFRQYFTNQSDAPLTPGQIEFIEENEQVIAETQEHNGYSLELKSVLSDSHMVLVNVGVTAPEGTTTDDLDALCNMGIDFYEQNGGFEGSWSMSVRDDQDGLENTVDLVFDINPAARNYNGIWTLRIEDLYQYFYNKEYEQELLNTKYAGQTNFIFTQEESEKISEYVLLAEGFWEFTIDLSNTDHTELELITTPVTTQSCYGYKPDGTEVYEDVQITSFILRPLSATIIAETQSAPEFSNNNDRRVFVVMKDGSRIELITSWGAVGEVHHQAASPIILEEVDYVLLADGTKLMVP